MVATACVASSFATLISSALLAAAMLSCTCYLLLGAVSQVAYRVGRTMFETSGLPRHLVDHCNAMDEVWLPTGEWCDPI